MPEPINILLVDDKPENLTVLESILEGADYRLTKAQSAQEALVALFATDFALIVLDVRMPETSGFELAKIIKERKRTRDVPIVFVTASYSEDEHILTGYSAGAVDYLTKPIKPAILKSKVAVFAELYRKTKALDEANQVLNRRNAELLAANQELEAFSYTVSHDLRAPLRGIAGYSSILVEDYEPKLDEEGKQVLGVIQRETERMGRLIDELLKFSRLGRQQMRSAVLDMTDIAKSVIEDLVARHAGQKPQLELGPLPPAHGDEALMRQVFVNLLSNALKFTRHKEVAKIDIGSQSDAEQNTYYVKDNGAGFDSKYSNKLFGVFQRLHREEEFEGTGVGLALVQRIIHRHGGRVWAEATLNEGATFYFTLPR